MKFICPITLSDECMRKGGKGAHLADVKNFSLGLNRNEMIFFCCFVGLLASTA
jgi:hypothetical protein